MSNRACKVENGHRICTVTTVLLTLSTCEVSSARGGKCAAEIRNYSSCRAQRSSVMLALMVSHKGRGLVRPCLSDWLSSREGCVCVCQGCGRWRSLHLFRVMPAHILMQCCSMPSKCLALRIVFFFSQCKTSPNISMHTSAVWRGSELNVTELSAAQGFVCRCYAAWLQASAKSASNHQSCPPRSKTQRLCLDQNKHCAQQGRQSSCAYLICLFFSVCLLRLLLVF